MAFDSLIAHIVAYSNELLVAEEATQQNHLPSQCVRRAATISVNGILTAITPSRPRGHALGSGVDQVDLLETQSCTHLPAITRRVG